MKILSLLFSFLISFNLLAGTCTGVTYTASAANSVLTSTKYNTDNSTVYNFVNAYDAGCVTSGTLEYDALSASSTVGFAVPLSAIFDGCKVTKVTAATLKIGNCSASINNRWVKTATDTTVAWANLDTGAEATNTYYYVYIDSTSAGTTLTPVISATAPGTDGLNGADRVIARFYNNPAGDIIDTVSQWHVNEFEPDRIMARYDSDAIPAIADSTVTIMNFALTTFGYDSHNVVTTGTGWTFRAPRAAKYNISSSMQFGASSDWTQGEFITLDVYVNGTFKARLDDDVTQTTVSHITYTSGGTTLSLNANDLVNIRVTHTAGGNITPEGAEEVCWVAIESVN